jgi:hypothetical protein
MPLYLYPLFLGPAPVVVAFLAGPTWMVGAKVAESGARRLRWSDGIFEEMGLGVWMPLLYRLDSTSLLTLWASKTFWKGRVALVDGHTIH